MTEISMQKGEKIRITIIISNKGISSLFSDPPHIVSLAYHWKNSAGNYEIYDNGDRTPLKEPLLPGETRKVQLHIEAPEIEGQYILEVTLIKELCFWFEDEVPGFSSFPIQVIVTSEQMRTNKRMYQISLNHRQFTEALNYYIKDLLDLGNAVREEDIFLCEVISVKEWCAKNNLFYKKLMDSVEYPIFSPLNRNQLKTNFLGFASLPEIYIAEVNNAIITGGHTPIIVNNDIALFDEYLQLGSDRFDYSQYEHIISFDSDDAILLHFNSEIGPTIDAGILLNGIYTDNYFHWLVEYLPRFWIIDQFPEYNNLPLIIPDSLHPNLLEALTMFNSRKRRLIPIRYGARYKINRLIIPSGMSYSCPGLKVNHDDSFEPSYEESALSPVAIQYLRKKLVIEDRISDHSRKNRLYLSRKSVVHRKLLNEREIEELFKKYQFQVITPETGSFREQLDLFSSAEIIGGPEGAAMTNCVFAPSDAIIISITNDERFYEFSNIAHIIGQYFISICGKIIWDSKLKYHSHFVADLNEVENAILCAFKIQSNQNNNDIINNSVFSDISLSSLVQKQETTDFSIELVNGQKINENIVKSSKKANNILIEGWAIDTPAKELAGGIFICFDSGQEYRAYYSLHRPDVAAHFNNEKLQFAGFISVINPNSLPVGTRSFRIKIVTHDRKGYYYPSQKNFILIY